MKKTDLGALPPLTRVVVSSYDSANELYPPPPLDKAKASAVATFIDSQRFNWTRAIGVGFGVPHPVYYAHLYEGNKYLGYFGVGAGVLPDSAALFEVRYGKIYARKRVSRSEANRFLDLIGRGGELSDTGDEEVRQQIANEHPRAHAVRVEERPAKFRPGDRVRVKSTGTQGIVCLRTSFFREHLYFITFPGSHETLNPIRQQEESATRRAAFEAEYGEWYRPRPVHEEGPFYQSDLEFVP